MHRGAAPEVKMHLRRKAFGKMKEDIRSFWNGQSQRTAFSQSRKQTDRIPKDHPEVVKRVADRMMNASAELDSGCIAFPPILPRVPGREMLRPDDSGVQWHPHGSRANQVAD